LLVFFLYNCSKGWIQDSLFSNLTQYVLLVVVFCNFGQLCQQKIHLQKNKIKSLI